MIFMVCISLFLIICLLPLCGQSSVTRRIRLELLSCMTHFISQSFSARAVFGHVVSESCPILWFSASRLINYIYIGIHYPAVNLADSVSTYFHAHLVL